MRKFLIATLLAVSLPSSAMDAEAQNQAAAFANIYASFCMKHLNNLEGLRTRLQPLPRLPPEKAAYFLSGRAGDAWPVPDKHGMFVLALHRDRNFCAVFARRADTASAEKTFNETLAHAPAPLVAKKVADDRSVTVNGPTHTMAYEWSVPNAQRRMRFTLTTASFDTAQLQVMGSAAIVRD